jgi:hypothetical protein
MSARRDTRQRGGTLKAEDCARDGRKGKYDSFRSGPPF